MSKTQKVSVVIVAIVAILGVFHYFKAQKIKEKTQEYFRLALEAEPQEAERLMRECLKIQPRNPSVYFLLGESLAQQGKHKAAIGVFKSGLKFSESSKESAFIKRRINSALAELYEDLGDYDAAIDYYTRNLTSGFTSARQGFLRVRLAELYRKKGDYSSAAREYEKAIKYKAAVRRPEIYFDAAVCKARDGETGKAFEYLSSLFNHPFMIGVGAGDGSQNVRIQGWINAATNSRLFEKVRTLPGFDKLIEKANQHAKARSLATKIYCAQITVPGFRREFPLSYEFAQINAHHAGFSRDVLLAYANDCMVSADYEIGDPRRFEYGFVACYYFFSTLDHAKWAVSALRKLSLPGAEWSSFPWTNRSLEGRIIGDETYSSDDKNGNIRLIFRKGNFVAVLYSGDFEHKRFEKVPPNIAPAMDSLAQQVLRVL